MAAEGVILALLSIIAGALILFVPGLLRFLIGGYLMVSGLIMLFLALP
ncbi:DUF3096 domain-containing protein [Candidatus Woesearchaeota archaeon]|nr:DUF3096 domain-containing protein [Candidatus Woesearchaeota archaeon]